MEMVPPRCCNLISMGHPCPEQRRPRWTCDETNRWGKLWRAILLMEMEHPRIWRCISYQKMLGFHCHLSFRGCRPWHILLMGSEIRRAPVEGKVVHPIIYGCFLYISVGCLGFLPSTVSLAYLYKLSMFFVAARNDQILYSRPTHLKTTHLLPLCSNIMVGRLII